MKGLEPKTDISEEHLKQMQVHEARLLRLEAQCIKKMQELPLISYIRLNPKEEEYTSGV